MGDFPVTKESAFKIALNKVIGYVQKNRKKAAVYGGAALLTLGISGVAINYRSEISEYLEEKSHRTVSLPDENAGSVKVGESQNPNKMVYASDVPVDSDVNPNKIAYQSGSLIGPYPADIQSQLDVAGNVPAKQAPQNQSSQAPQMPQLPKGKDSGKEKPKGKTPPPKPEPVEYFEPWSGTGWSEPNYPSSDEKRRTSYGPSYTSGSNGLVPSKEKLKF